MTPQQAWYAEMAESFGRTASVDVAQGWDGSEESARLAAHFGRLALGEALSIDECRILIAQLVAERDALKAQLEIALGALADIGWADDMELSLADGKARRVYRELRSENKP